MSLRSVGSRRLAVVNGISGFGVADGGGGSWIQAQVFRIPGWERDRSNGKDENGITI